MLPNQASNVIIKQLAQTVTTAWQEEHASKCFSAFIGQHKGTSFNMQLSDGHHIKHNDCKKYWHYYVRLKLYCF